LWEWFADLSRRRSNGGLAPNPVSFSEIDAWARLTGTAPTPWEVSVLTRLDDALLSKPAKDKPTTMVDAGDGAAVGALLAGFKKA
jgi:hypothetical protein